jgi:hypothetical protein
MEYCDVCEKDVNKYNFQDHIKTKIHMNKLNKVVKMYKCDKCEFQSNFRQTTYKHKKTHEENKEKVYFFHCNICDKQLCNNTSIKKHTVSDKHKEILIAKHPELNLNKDMPMLPFKINRIEAKKHIVELRTVKTIKRIVQKVPAKKIENVEVVEAVFDHKLYLDRETEAFNIEQDELMKIYEKLIEIFNKRKIVASIFLKRAIVANKDYNDNILSLQILVQKYANAIEINIKNP